MFGNVIRLLLLRYGILLEPFFKVGIVSFSGQRYYCINPHLGVDFNTAGRARVASTNAPLTTGAH